MNKNYIQIVAATIILIILSCGNLVSAQTCSVNAGVDQTICSKGTMTLRGNSTGKIKTAAKWAFISGPNVPIITSPSSATTTVKGFIAGTYVFRYYATCTDNVQATDTVRVFVDPAPTFTAGNDTFVCGNSTTLNATLPSGATGFWTSRVVSNVSGATFSSATSPSSNVTVSDPNYLCPKKLNVIWRVTKGACVLRDTAVISFGNQAATFDPIPDQTICGTVYTTPNFYIGCGGTIKGKAISGPTAATISYNYGSGVPTSNTVTSINYGSLVVGTYTFATEILSCSGTFFRDTFSITVAGTVAVTNAGVYDKYLCPNSFDSVYFFNPTVSLLPGETMTWNLTPTYIYPGSLPAPVASTVGNTLRLRAVTNPDTTSASTYYQYQYSYNVFNGTCTNTYYASLVLYTPMRKATFRNVINLPCGADSAIITQMISGPVGLYYDQTTVVSKPLGAADPTILEAGSATQVNDLEPGKYVFTFRYSVGGCEYKTNTVEVNVGLPAGLSNAGTDQILPCDQDSTIIAGNAPIGNQIGTWQLVSGPSSVVLTNPNSPSLLLTSLVPGRYRLRWSISYGAVCPANADDMNIVVTTGPTPCDAGPDTLVCYGSPIALTGSAFGLGVTARWKQISGPAVTIADSTASSTTFSGAIASTVYKFTYKLSNACGFSIDTVVITTKGTSGPTDAVITTADTCITVNSLTLRAAPISSGSGVWTQVSGPGGATIATPTSNVTSVTGLVGAAYKFVWSVSGIGCDTRTDTVLVAYRPSALTANAGSDQDICGTTLTMNANTPSLGVGTWTQIGGAGTAITNINSPTTTVTGLSFGATYDYVWTVSLGVCPAAKDSVHIIVSTPASTAVAMGDPLFCGIAGTTLNVPITATAPTSGVGAWSVLSSPVGTGPVYIAAPSSPSTTALVSGGITKLIWQVGGTGSCTASYDTVTIEMIPIVDAGANLNLCEAANTTLAGTAPGRGTATWTQLSGPSAAVFSDPNGQNTTVSNLIVGTYKFKYTVSHPSPSCSGFDSVTVINYAKPIANAGADATICWVAPSVPISLTADTVGTGGPATVNWSRTLGNGSVSYIPGSSVASTVATVTAPGDQQFLLTVSNPGCTVKDFVDIIVDRPTVLGFTLTPRSSCNDTFAITANVPVAGLSYHWEMPTAARTDTSGIDLRGPIPVRFLNKGNNKIYLTLTNTVTGCTAKDSITIFVCNSIIPPIANNITAAPMNSSNVATPIPQLKASNPSGTAIRDYDVLTLPLPTEGILYYCATAPATCSIASLTPVAIGTKLTPAQSASLYFDPVQTFTGNVNFTYKATDTNNLESNIATYTIPVYNNPPVTQNIRTAVMPNTTNNIFIPHLISGDADGKVDSFYIYNIPDASLGILNYCSNATDPCTIAVTPISTSTVLTPAQMLTLKFDPDPSYSGDYIFEYQSIDNNGNLSNISTYTIPIVELPSIFLPPVNLPPVANNIIAQPINNSAGPTVIPNLRGTDPDGLVVSYTIGNILPNPTTEGTLYYCAAAPASCTPATLSPVIPGQTMSLDQAASLQFDPVPSFVGTTNFTYTATDNNGVPLVSEPAIYIIPVVNMPPVANPASVNPILNTLTTPTLLPPLSGYDVDGTVISYNIVDVPGRNQGVLKYCATAPGTPCTAATLSTISAALADLTPAQIATLHFIPNPGFTGNYVFHFTTVDNNGLESQPAAFTIPVVAFGLNVGAPPVAYSYNSPTIKSIDSVLLSSALSGMDPDGTVVNYTITTITPPNEGTLTYCATPPTGCGTPVTVGLVMTPAQAATIQFKPISGFSGVSTFNYINTDNSGNPSNTATVTIPVINNPPFAKNIINTPISKTAPATTLNPLSATDADGTVVSYKILTIPTPDQGVLKLCVTAPSVGCVPVAPGDVLTPAQIGNLTFTPTLWLHSPVVTFLYTSLDNSGNIGNIAAVNIPFFDVFPLPVELLTFDVTKQNRNAMIEWTIGVEKTAINYQVQHSTDGKSWEVIENQNGRGNNKYSYLHTNVPNGIHYYRLKMVELDNSAAYGPVRSVVFDGAQTYSIMIQPNPVTDLLFISTSDGSAMENVIVTSNDGRKLQEFTKLNSGSSIDMNGYSQGLYLIKIIDKNGEAQTVKVSKN